MHESTQHAGFPNKGFGFRKAFAIVARNSLDTLVDKIAVSHAGKPLGLPDPETSAVGEPDILAARPTGLPQQHVPRSLASIRAPPHKEVHIAVSTRAEQPSPYTKHFDIGTPSTDKAILATTNVRSSSSSLSSSSKSSEPKPRNLAASLEALKQQAKGMLGMMGNSPSSSSSSTSKTKTKSKETSGSSEALSQAHSYLSLASDELQAKLVKARVRAEVTKAKLEQIEADAELAMLLQYSASLSIPAGPAAPPPTLRFLRGPRNFHSGTLKTKLKTN